MGISEVTRQDIIDIFSNNHINWYGRLEEIKFIARLYDLENMPSTDRRFDNAAEDIWQHRFNNDDWEDNWIFDDERFGLSNGNDNTLLRFLCETIHPIVRPNLEEVSALLQKYNQLLAPDGYELFDEGEISGRPIFAARQIPPLKSQKLWQNAQLSEFEYKKPQPLLRALARLFASEGAAVEVAILANSLADIKQLHDEFISKYMLLYLEIPMYLYSQISIDIEKYEERILGKVILILRGSPGKLIDGVRIRPDLSEDPNWQEKAKVWLAGKNITNQGRVRSDNIASRNCEPRNPSRSSCKNYNACA
ncbi:MAG TPA: hypothetical protein V6D15_15135 [Oculatellaceae cyanobacterium]|jgi:hypothetical protein